MRVTQLNDLEFKNKGNKILIVEKVMRHMKYFPCHGTVIPWVCRLTATHSMKIQTCSSENCTCKQKFTYNFSKFTNTPKCKDPKIRTL